MPDNEWSESARAILEYLEENGETPQSELWKNLDISSRTVSRHVRNLEDEGAIEREQVTYEGSNTYMVSLPPKSADELDFSLLMAGNMISPFIDDETVDERSDEFDQWLINLRQEMEDAEEP